MTSKPAARSTPWAIIALGAVLGFGAYLLFVSGDPLPFDESWEEFARVEPGSVAFGIAGFLAEVGSKFGAGACGAITAALLLAIRERREAGAVITALIVGVALSELLKLLVDRQRPIDLLYSVSGSSYPSGHSMGAAALAVSLAFAVSTIHHHSGVPVSRSSVRWAWLAAWAWVLAMMWSRTALGVHWLSDAIAGAALGTAVAVLATRVWGRPRGITQGYDSH